MSSTAIITGASRGLGRALAGAFVGTHDVGATLTGHTRVRRGGCVV